MGRQSACKYAAAIPWIHFHIQGLHSWNRSSAALEDTVSCSVLFVGLQWYGPGVMLLSLDDKLAAVFCANSSRFSERELTFTLLYAIARPSVCHLSVVCNVRAFFSGDWNFRQCFYAIWYLGHLLPFDKNFTEMVPGELISRGGG